MTPFELHFLEHNHARLAFDICRNQDVQPTQILLLINGFQRTRLDFRALRQKLLKSAPHVVTVSFDNRYCGETVIHQELDTESSQIFSQDAFAVLNHCMNLLQINRVSILGISMGGMIAQECVHFHPSLNVDNLFLVSTTAGGPSRVWSTFIENPLEYQTRPKDLEDVQKKLSLYFGDKFKKNSPLLFELFSKGMAKSNQQENTDLNAHKQFVFTAHFDSTPWLDQLNVKNTFLFAGREDKIIPAENMSILQQKIPGSKLFIYEEIGHLILIEHPEVFVNDLSFILNASETL